MINKHGAKYIYTCDSNGCVYSRRNLTRRQANIEGTEHPKTHLLSCGHHPSVKCICDSIAVIIPNETIRWGGSDGPILV